MKEIQEVLEPVLSQDEIGSVDQRPFANFLPSRESQSNLENVRDQNSMEHFVDHIGINEDVQQRKQKRILVKNGALSESNNLGVSGQKAPDEESLREVIDRGNSGSKHEDKEDVYSSAVKKKLNIVRMGASPVYDDQKSESGSVIELNKLSHLLKNW